MKKILLVIFITTVTFNLNAQISEGGLPPSFKSEATKNSASLASYNLTAPDTTGFALYNNQNPLPLRYALLEDIDLDLKENATKTVMPDGSTVWQYRINSPAGRSLQVIFSKYLVAEGAQLFLYNEDYSTVRGAYTELNITENLMFVTGDFPGDHVIIEYYEPSGVEFEGEITIGSVGQAYTDIWCQRDLLPPRPRQH